MTVRHQSVLFSRIVNLKVTLYFPLIYLIIYKPNKHRKIPQHTTDSQSIYLHYRCKKIHKDTQSNDKQTQNNYSGERTIQKMNADVTHPQRHTH